MLNTVAVMMSSVLTVGTLALPAPAVASASTPLKADRQEVQVNRGDCSKDSRFSLRVVKQGRDLRIRWVVDEGRRNRGRWDTAIRVNRDVVLDATSRSVDVVTDVRVRDKGGVRVRAHSSNDRTKEECTGQVRFS